MLHPHRPARVKRFAVSRRRASPLVAALLVVVYFLHSRPSETHDAAFVSTVRSDRGPTTLLLRSSDRAVFGKTALRARRFIVGGNWKANGTPESVKQLIQDLNNGKVEIDTPKDMEVVLAPPMVYLSEVQQALRPDFAVAAQNMWDQSPGAWTGETPADMLSSLGVEWVVLGHSERRENNGETNEVVAAKTKFAIDAGLRPITCIGEKLEARESGETFHVLEEQMQPLADVLTEEDWGKVVLAYEPVWAIGTGLTATPEQAEETHAFLRQWLKDNVSPEVSNSVRIQYGGSVSDENSAELSAKPNIDGFLVGGASLVGDKFTSILNSVHESNFGQDTK